MGERDDGLRILALRVSNVKRIRAIDVRPDLSEPIVKIAGRNGQGKSSTLDAIQYALAGARAQAAVPVRVGENEAYSELDIDVPGKGVLKVRRHWKPNGSQELRVVAADGATVTRAQELLNSLVSSISFDPLGFAELEPAKQVQALVQLVGVDIAAYQGRRRSMMDARADLNKEAERELAAARSVGSITGVRLQDEEPVRAELRAVSDIASQAAAWDKVRDGLRRDLEAQAGVVKKAEDYRDELVSKLKAAEAALKAADVELGRIERAFEEHAETVRPTPAPTAEIMARLEALQASNARARTEAEAVKHGDRAQEFAKRAAGLTAEIAALDAAFQDTLAGARWPITGLSVTEGAVTYRGLPLEQCSSAERIRVACAIGIAMGKDIRVLLVREGSLLDDESVAVVRSIAAAHGFQVWMERVGDEPDAVIIEDGVVARLPGPVAEAVAAGV
jgi:DNA repair ATPase RecN